MYVCVYSASVWHQADQRKGKRLSKPKVEMTETSKNSDEPKLEPTRRVLSDAEQAERMPGYQHSKCAPFANTIVQ